MDVRTAIKGIEDISPVVVSIQNGKIKIGTIKKDLPNGETFSLRVVSELKDPYMGADSSMAKLYVIEREKPLIFNTAIQMFNELGDSDFYYKTDCHAILRKVEDALCKMTKHTIEEILDFQYKLIKEADAIFENI